MHNTSLEGGSKTYFCIVDASSGFDTLWHDSIFFKLHFVGINGRLRKSDLDEMIQICDSNGDTHLIIKNCSISLLRKHKPLHLKRLWKPGTENVVEKNTNMQEYHCRPYLRTLKRYEPPVKNTSEDYVQLLFTLLLKLFLNGLMYYQNNISVSSACFIHNPMRIVNKYRLSNYIDLYIREYSFVPKSIL